MAPADNASVKAVAIFMSSSSFVKEKRRLAQVASATKPFPR